METVRQPAVAGRFYPGRATELLRDVDRLLAEARQSSARSPHPPKALIVPHAGYVYSGPTAACGYALLERERVGRVVLIGPAHQVAVHGLALSSADAFVTPLGRVPLDHEVQDRLCALPQVIRSDVAHAPEHSLEVQLPFLQRVLGEITLVPIVVGDATPEEVAGVIEACWDGPETLVLVSSDLSHYLPYAHANALDADTLRRILACRWPLPDGSACGGRAVSGLLRAAKAHGMGVVLLDHRTSGDTAGDKRSVVGYAAVSFTEEPHQEEGS